MKKLHVILLITFGVFMIPSITYACEEGQCKKETSKTENKGCCKQKSDSADNHLCGGKCGHKGCGCASVATGGVTFVESFEIAKIPQNQIFKKQKFYYHENHLSSGYNFLWLIPKIS